ncbi:ABC transporter ATP-binding protein [Actinomadura sp. ATCC 31491]|uniref:ABC transporter ATP-binding protein n=1 Tax=Actinomadura luzonensis TaxID=2805427 RepID=A0ABT0G9U9_9ACTN|nr:ABC transporter ATP-binding protein [Actinomadura luzonensis]MCK2221372.1 ABC transporter ATP-binding protein [Actinomadura luzonensis]
MSADTLATAKPAVELEGITKRFPGVVANHDIRITVRPGTVHAIVGENGAGKSTLMKILYGMQKPDEGTIKVNGTEVSFRTPSDAIAVGIGMVHQHFMLADNLTVLENIVLGAEPTKAGVLDTNAARVRIEQLAASHGLRVDPGRLVEDLGVGDRQRVEILKVLYRGARILILDEPTAVLVPQEVEELFQNLRELKAEGLTVIFISHKLDEVLDIADAITVIRRGTTVASMPRAEVASARQLAELMVGSELPTPETRESTVTDRVAFQAAHLTVETDGKRRLLDDVSFDIHEGEILGIAGVEGNGQSELIEAIMGIRPAQGLIRLAGQDVSAWPTLKRREAGIGYIPEDRHRQGLLLEASLWENRVLGHQTRKPARKGIWVDRRASKADTERIVKEYDVRTPSVETLALALSGGNQQKLIVGREMSSEPKFLIAAHPTRGVDVGAQAAIWDHLRNARAAGLAVLLISADLDELIGLSDTIRVIYRGRLVAALDPSDITPERLGGYMTGAIAGTEET